MFNFEPPPLEHLCFLDAFCFLLVHFKHVVSLVEFCTLRITDLCYVRVFFIFYFFVLQICEMDPGLYRDCSEFVSSLKGRFELLAHSVHLEEVSHVDHCDDYAEGPGPSRLPKESTDSESQLSEKLQKQATVSGGNENAKGEGKQIKCSTCNAFFGDSNGFRDHSKSEWHKHNIKRKTRQLPPLTEEECMADMEVGDSRADLKDYSF